MSLLKSIKDDVKSMMDVGVAMFNLVADVAFYDEADDNSTYFSDSTSGKSQREKERRQYRKAVVDKYNTLNESTFGDDWDETIDGDEDLSTLFTRESDPILGGSHKKQDRSDPSLGGSHEKQDRTSEKPSLKETSTTKALSETIADQKTITKAEPLQKPVKESKVKTSSKKSSQKDNEVTFEQEKESVTTKSCDVKVEKSKKDKNKEKKVSLDSEERDSAPQTEVVQKDTTSCVGLSRSPSLAQCTGIVGKRAALWQKNCERNKLTPTWIPNKSIVSTKYGPEVLKLNSTRKIPFDKYEVDPAPRMDPTLPDNYDHFVHQIGKWHKQETRMFGKKKTNQHRRKVGWNWVLLQVLT
jgi:hypothetical protein